MKNPSNLVHLAETFRKSRVLCVGDVMLDRFVNGDISRISPEAPVAVLRSRETNSVLGGAGNVVRNLLALGGCVWFVSAIGDDAAGQEVKNMLASFDRVDSTLIVVKSRETSVKIRFTASSQQVLRVDRETTDRLDQTSRERLLRAVMNVLKNSDVIVLSDYNKGVLCDETLRNIIEIGRDNGKLVMVDPKGADYSRYRNASLLTPNLKELKEATRLPVDGDEAVVSAARALIEKFDVDAVLVTRGKDGMTLVQSYGKVCHLDTIAREVFDVSGAGDTVIATMAAATGVGISLTSSAAIANVAAGIVVGKAGTAVTHASELTDALYHRQISTAEAKVTPLDIAQERVDLWRRKGLKIGFTNGCFDLLHPGHISLLAQAAETCDRLIVGLNSDSSVKRLKNDGRPIQHEAARSTVLASLENVDLVVIFREDTPLRLLETLRPDVLIKGADYKSSEVVGADFVKKYGGKVVLAELAQGYSTTATIARLNNCGRTSG